MPTYDLSVVDPAVRNSSQTLELEMVGRDRTVLDVGCATGYLARALVEQGCTVSGIEVDPESAELARPSLEELVVADLNTADLAELLPGRTFDSIVFGDVLEHLLDPDRVLRSATRLLAPGGSIVISVPNITHGAVRLALLQGRWRYTESGLLDRTHLHFYTRESALDMVRKAGLIVTDLYATVLDPLNCEVEIDDEALPWAVVDWVRRQPDAYVYQFVMRTTVSQEWTEPPELVPVVDLPDVQDVHVERAAVEARLHAGTDGRSDVVAEVVDTRRRLLTLRDHAIGAEATVATARREVAAARAEAEHERDEKERLLAEMRATATWRVGSTVVAPASKVVRRLLRGASDR